ncbi:MAG: hypothetical protein U0903_07750 [Planctomycetales bacterium]
MSADSAESPQEKKGAEADHRLYFPDHEGWTAQIKRSWENEYCFTANPGQDFFHLLVNGEIYVQKGAEKYCLNCALRQKVITGDRQYWQRSTSSFETSVEPPEIDGDEF